jgi:hypothetical protein
MKESKAASIETGEKPWNEFMLFHAVIAIDVEVIEEWIDLMEGEILIEGPQTEIEMLSPNTCSLQR